LYLAAKEEITRSIGTVGSGIAGLHPGLFLQKHGVESTIELLMHMRYEDDPKKFEATMQNKALAWRRL